MRIIDYIFGSRRGQEANEIEKQSMSDAFLADAIEGYDSVYDNHHDVLGDLKQKVAVSAAKKSRKFMLQGRKFYFVAAAVLVVVGSVGLLLLRKPVVAIDQMAVNMMAENHHINEELVDANVFRDNAGDEGISVDFADDSLVGIAVKKEQKVEIAPISNNNRQKNLEGVAAGENKLIKGGVVDNKSAENAADVKASSGSKGRSRNIVDDDATKIVESGDALRGTQNYTQKTKVSPSLMTETEASGSAREFVEGEEAPGIRVLRNIDFEKYFAANVKTINSFGPSGSVVAEFRVNDAGVPTSIRVLTGISSEANRKVIELLVSGPVWEPTNGERVRVVFKY